MAYSPPLEPSNLFSIAEERNGDRMEEIQLEMRPMGKVEMDGGGRTEKMYSGRLSSIGNNHGPPCPTERTHLRKSSSPDTSLIENSGEVYGIVQLNVYKIRTLGVDGGGGLGEIWTGRKERREIARWIKYEQDLEEGADRLGRPHIAPLAFHFLMRLNALIEKNAIALLDLDEKDMGGIGIRITEVLGAAGLIQPDERSSLMEDLLLTQRLAPERDKGGFVAKLTNNSGWEDSRSVEPSSPQTLVTVMDRRSGGQPKPRNILLRKMAFANKRSLSFSFPFQQRRESDTEMGGEIGLSVGGGKSTSPRDSLFPSDAVGPRNRRRRSSLQSIVQAQASAESAIILLRGEYKRRRGELVFVRLAEATPLSDVSMIPTPTRILVLILVPNGMEEDFVEMGKSLGTLLANRRFYETGLRATSLKDLVWGMNEFLQESIVLPPGDYYSHERLYDLLPQHELVNKSNLIRRQKEKGAQKGGLHQQLTDSVDSVHPLPQEQIMETKSGVVVNEIPGPFIRTGKPFGGLVNDIRRRYPGYKRDILDGLSIKCLAATIFLYFASIAHNITFGGLLAQKTNGFIGVIETFVAATGSGLLFALFAGQPILPIAPTAPLLLFDEILYRFLDEHGFEFLPARAWIGLWVFIISIVYVALEGSVIVKNFTRFTQETFAALISVVFVVESCTALFNVYKKHPLSSPPLLNQTDNPWVAGLGDSLEGELDVTSTTSTESPKVNLRRNEPNTALLSTFLMFGTFFIGFTLKRMRASQLLGQRLRNTLSDFSVPIAIFVMVSVDLCAGDVFTEKVQVPRGFETTRPDARGWFIPMWGMERPLDPWVPLITLLPGTLVFILMSMTAQICELILSEREKFDKGNGFHLDVLILGLINFGSGLFGLPWLSCATLKALAHCSALTVFSSNNPPGSPPVVLYIIQERLTSLVMSVLIGLSILAAPLLQYMSMSILFGVFLYMGVTSLLATQFYERVLLFITPSQDHPPTIYVRRVPTWKIHLFTLVQIGCIVLLWIVKSIKAIALTFPFIIMLLVPIRISLKHIFTDNELEALDGKPKAAGPEKSAEKSN